MALLLRAAAHLIPWHAAAPFVIADRPTHTMGERILLGQQLPINCADEPALQLLPGVGPSLAHRIVLDRTTHGAFHTLADFDRVRGIGPKTLDRLRPWVSAEKCHDGA